MNFSVTQNGKSLDKSLYTWDEKTRTFSTNESGLVLDFNGIDGCTFKTGYGCTFDTGSNCTFNTGWNCTFNTGWNCTFKTGYDCTFKTGDDCTFNTGWNCTFNTGWNCTFNTGDSCTFLTLDMCNLIYEYKNTINLYELDHNSFCVIRQNSLPVGFVKESKIVYIKNNPIKHEQNIFTNIFKNELKNQTPQN